MKLKDDVKVRFLAALRSGDFEQGKGALRRDNKYCCLGVLCELSPVEPYREEENSRYYFDGDSSALPSSVQQWALVDPAGDMASSALAFDVTDDDLEYLAETFGFTSSVCERISAMAMNDSGIPFTVIADFVERYL